MTHIEATEEPRGCCDRPHDGHDCCPPGRARVRGFTHCWLLLQLGRAPAHGYELLERLSAVEVGTGIDPGSLYRTLRGLEEEGLVQSSWDTAGSGPARRVYGITDLGREYLQAWAVHIRTTRDRLDQFLADYETLKDREGGENDARTPQPR